DTLRTLVIYTDDVEDVSSSGESELEAGDYVSLVEEPTAWKLSYKGLDLASEDRYNLKFEIKTSNREISENKGPLDGYFGAGDDQTACTIWAPYIEVSSGDTGSVFEMDSSDRIGTDLSNSEFYIAINTAAPGPAQCDDDGPGEAVDAGDPTLSGGSVFMKLSSSSNDYGFQEYNDLTSGYLEVRYDDIGDGDSNFVEGGAIVIQDTGDVGGGDGYMGELLSSDAGSTYDGNSDGIAHFLFAVSEKAGSGSANGYVDYFMFGVTDTSTGDAGDASFDFNSYDTSGTTSGDQITSDDEEVLYGHATDTATKGVGNAYDGNDPVSGPVQGGLEFVEEGYISERGSVFDMIDDNTVEFDMAHKLAHAQWWLGPSETSSASDSTTVVTLGEGESTTVGGVTVKVLEITEDVGACSAAGGAVSCTADMSGVSAVIMPNNAPSVEVAVPYTGNYGNLVILDTDAVGVNTLVSVGGDKVNSVTAELLEGSAVDWTAESKVVREVVQGSKIVVAGVEAPDTLEAAQDFVSQLQKA
ncbi:hypothetical protein KKE38_03760, partial [Candidatus Micrarchaeota archaeon]|nr:hypothetical protein [Candidatus Micrarchaeota archaeon]